MLRLVVNDVAAKPDSPSAWLIDDEGNVAAEGHVIAAADDVDLGNEVITGLRFVGKGAKIAHGTSAPTKVGGTAPPTASLPSKMRRFGLRGLEV